MWLSRKAAEVDSEETSPCQIGIVSIGGAKPALVTDGETRSAHLAKLGGAVYIPRAGDEVVSVSTRDGDEIVIGFLSGKVVTDRAEGDVFISNGSDAFICIRNDGIIELSGDIQLNGRVDVSGALYVNGVLYEPCGE